MSRPPCPRPAAARDFGTTRVTVRKWRDRYLADRSRAPRHIPQKTSEWVARRLIELRERYPCWGVDRLLVHFKISCSRSAAARILRQAGLKKRRKKKRLRNKLRAQKARMRPFEHSRADTKDLSDMPAYRA